MRRLFPTPAADVDPRDAYAVPAGPHLRVNMVASVDGAAAVAGRVGALSGRADDAVLHVLRALADVILVGAGTIRAEGYGPALVPPDEQCRRAAAGDPPMPRLAIVTRSLDLDLAAPLFTAAAVRPLIVTTTSAPAGRHAAASEVADVITAGAERVDMPAALDALADRGLPRVLSEGGPHLLAELYAADRVDELCLTVSPRVTCGHELRITAGLPLPQPAGLHLAHVLEEDEFLFLRYMRMG
jgi:riboflavin biosynthesis pyrimidine reductase